MLHYLAFQGMYTQTSKFGEGISQSQTSDQPITSWGRNTELLLKYISHLNLSSCIASVLRKTYKKLRYLDV